MDFAGAYLFNKKPEDMRRVGALGGRARARNLRLRNARPVSVTREISRPPEETASEAIRRIDALCPWLAGVERREARRHAGT
jgi:hypothetical protein